MAEEKLVLRTKRILFPAEGKHKAFPAIYRYKDFYYVAYREGTQHLSDDGALVVKRSRDLEKWEQVFYYKGQGYDVRDTKFYAINDRLFLMWPARLVTQPKYEFEVLFTFTSNGTDWSSPQKMITIHHPGIWSPYYDSYEAKIYGAFYRYTDIMEPDNWELALYSTEDGVHWQKMRRIYRGDYVNETALYRYGEVYYYLLRREKYNALLGISALNGDLQFNDIGFPLHSPAFFELNKRLYVGGREFVKNKKMIEGREYEEYVRIYAVYKEALQPVLEVDSGINVDSGYPSFCVINQTQAIMIYYYGSASLSDIYLALIEAIG